MLLGAKLSSFNINTVYSSDNWFVRYFANVLFPVRELPSIEILFLQDSKSLNFSSVVTVKFLESKFVDFGSRDGKTKYLLNISPSLSFESVSNSFWNSGVNLKWLLVLNITFLLSITFVGLYITWL